MGSKEKGTRAERELLHLFWEQGWASSRMAGSGSIPLPSPDIIAGTKDRVLAIECKSIKKGGKYFYKEEIEQLKEFADRFGAEPWLGIRFDNIGWFFIQPEHLKQTEEGNFSVSLDLAKKKGLVFDVLVKKDLIR